MDDVTASEIAQNLDTAEDKARYDAAAKKLVAQKAVLAYILKSALDEFAEIPVKRIAEDLIEGTPQVSEAAVHQDYPDARPAGNMGAPLSGSDRIGGMPTEDTSIREGTVHYDIRFMALAPKNHEQMEIIVNVEIQNKDMPGYPIPKRGIYYGSRLISAQRGTVFKNQEYGKIKKVTSIWVCEDTALERSDAINEYRLTEKCRRGTYREAEENYDLMRVVVMRLGARGEESEDDAIRLLSKVFSPERTAADKKTVLSEEFHIDVTEEMNREVESVCNLSTGIYDKGKREGLLEGKREGLLEGKREGLLEGKREGLLEGKREGKNEGALEMLFSLVKNNLLSIAVAAKQADMDQTVFERKYKNYISG